MPLFINDVPIDCINRAAIQYHVPATLIISVLVTEEGRVGTASSNKNGTYDYGSMQINTIWLNALSHYGYSKQDIQWNACKNVLAGAWILSQNIADGENPWRGIGNYHSHYLFENKKYQQQIRSAYNHMNQYLNNG